MTVSALLVCWWENTGIIITCLGDPKSGPEGMSPAITPEGYCGILKPTRWKRTGPPHTHTGYPLTSTCSPWHACMYGCASRCVLMEAREQP